MIECHELPVELACDQGDYELRWGNDPEKSFYHDIISLKRELKSLIPKRVDDILDRLQNFRIAYINLATGEIYS